MSSFLRDIVLRFSGEDAGIGKTVAGIASQAKKAGVSVADIGKVASTTGGALTKGVTVPIAAMAGAAVKAAIDYESAFAGVRKTVDMTESQYADLYDATVKLAGEQPVSAETLFSIEEMAGQLGISNDKLLDFSKTVAGLDLATNLSAEDAATQLARFVNITGESQDNVSNLGSALVDLGNNYATTESEIMAMSMRLAAGTTTVGISADRTLGLAAAMSSLGIEAEAGGSSVSTVLSKLDKAVAKGGESLEEFASVSGMSASEFAAAWRSDPMAAFESLIVGLGEVEGKGGNLNLVLEDLGITELRQVDAMKRLSGGWESVGGAIGTATDAYASNTALQAEVDKRNETTQAQLETLRNKVTNAAAELGGPLAAALSDVIDRMDPVIEGVTSAAEWFTSLDEDTQGFIITVGGIAAATGPALSAIGSIADTADGIGSAFKTISEKMSEVDGKDLSKTSTNIGNVATSAGTAKTNLSNAVTAAGNLNGIDESAAVGQINSIGTAAGTVSDTDIPAIETAAGDVNKNVDLGDAEGKFDDVGKASKDAAEDIKGEDGIVKAAESVNTGVDLDTAEGEFSSVETASISAADAIDGEDGIAAAADKVDDSVDLYDSVKEITTVGAAADDVADEALPSITDAAGKVDGNVNLDDATEAVSGVGEAADGVVTKAGGMKEALINIGRDVAVLAVFGMIINQISTVASKLERVSELSGGVKGALDQIGEANVSPDGLADLSDVIDRINEGAETSIKDYSEYVEDTAESLQDIDKDAARLDVYVGIIEQLGGKSKLSALEQDQLKAAVEGFNDIAGESTLTIDEQTGRLEQSIDTVHELADTWEDTARRTALATAYQESLVQMEMMEAQVNSLQEARDQLAEGQFNPSDLLGFLPDVTLFTGDFDESARWDAVNKNLEEARAAYAGAAGSAEYLKGKIDELGEAEQVATDAANDNASANGDVVASADSAASAVSEWREATEDEADALSGLSDHVKDVVSGVENLDGSLKAAISATGQDLLEFGLLIESTGGSVERFGKVYETLASAGDPFAEAAHSLPIVDGQARTLAGDLISIEEAAGNASRTTGEMFATIQNNQAVIDQFDEVVRELYSQAETEADIAFVDSLVERGPAALGELQNIAGTYEDAQVSLHELADAQAQYESSVTSAAINAELERIAANYRVLGEEALGTVYTIDEATGNVVTVVGEGADEMVVMFDRATGEVVSVLEASAPEAREAAEQVKQAASSGVDGVEESFSEAGEQAAEAMSEGIEGGSDKVSDSSEILGDDAEGALATLPDEFEARGMVAGYELAFGIKSQTGQATSAAESLVSAANEGAKPISDDFWDRGRSAGMKLRLGITSTYNQAYAAGASVTAGAISGMDTGYGDAYTVGVGLTMGLAYGIGDSGAVQAVRNAAAGAVTEAVNAAKSAGEIKSPSRVMARVGDNWDEGLAWGIERSARRVTESAYRTMQSTLPQKIESPSLAAGGQTYNISVNLDYSAGEDGTAIAYDIARALGSRLRMEGAYAR